MRPPIRTLGRLLVAGVATLALVLVAAVIARAELPRELKRVQPNLCRVVAKDRSAGSGCYLGAGLVLTADHVTRDSSTGKVDFFGGGEYRYEVVGRSKQFDASYLRIERPIEASIRGVPLAGDVGKGTIVWKAGYGRTPGKLYWHKGTVASITSNGRIELTPYSISGDSGGPVFTIDGKLIGCLHSTSIGTNRTYANLASTTAKTLGPIAKDVLDVEYALVADCGPNCRSGGGLLPWLQPRSGSGPNTAPRAPGGIPAETLPAPDTSVISATMQAMRAESDAALAAAQMEIEAARAESEAAANELQRQARQHEVAEAEAARQAELDTLQERIDAAEDRANRVDPVDLVARYIGWIVAAIVLIILLWRRKQEGTVTVAGVRQDVATAQAAGQHVADAVAPAPSPAPTPGANAPMPHSVAARAAASKVREAKALAAEEEARAKREIARASEDAQRDVQAITEAAEELGEDA